MGLTPADERRIRKIIRDTLRLPRYLPQLSDEVPDDGDVIKWDDDKKKYRPTAPAAGHDSVTLDANADTILDLSTQEIGLDNQSANELFAGPTSGAAATPAFRALVSADLPSIAHGDLSDAPTNAHHNESHTVASHSDTTATGTELETLTDGSDASSLHNHGDEHYTINFVIDGGGSAITTGIKGDIEVPDAGTIVRAALYADQTGSITVDIWKDTYANFPPTDADTITGSNEPAISSGTKDEDETLTSWTTSVSAKDILRFNVDSATTIERVTVVLRIKR